MSYGQWGIAWLHCFSLSVSVKDRPLRWILVMSQTYYPKHMFMGASWVLALSRPTLLLSCHGFRLFPDRLSEWFLGGGPSNVLSPGLGGGGLESKFRRGPRPRDRRVVGWSCLCLWYKRGVCFRVPSWAYSFVNRR